MTQNKFLENYKKESKRYITENLHNNINELKNLHTEKFLKKNLENLKTTIDKEQFVIENYHHIIENIMECSKYLDLSIEKKLETHINLIKNIKDFKFEEEITEKKITQNECVSVINSSIIAFEILINIIIKEEADNEDEYEKNSDDKFKNSNINKIFLAKLPDEIDEKVLEKHFSKCGPIKRCLKIKDKKIAFITFENESGFKNALKFHGTSLFDHTLIISKSKE
jgi:hypothetical protein